MPPRMSFFCGVGNSVCNTVSCLESHVFVVQRWMLNLRWFGAPRNTADTNTAYLGTAIATILGGHIHEEFKHVLFRNQDNFKSTN